MRRLEEQVTFYLFIYLFYKMREMKYQIPDRDTKWDMRQQRLLCEQSLRNRVDKAQETSWADGDSTLREWALICECSKTWTKGSHSRAGIWEAWKSGLNPKDIGGGNLTPTLRICLQVLHGGALKGQISLQLKKQSTPVHHMWVHLLTVGSPLHHFWRQVAQHPGLPR